ncbi:MAG: hypothetical protein WCV90_05495 [Candidatus Woesearchaeota archaeon]|jgi:phosphate uptake regulator
MAIIERNVQQIGQSLFISLPSSWTKMLKVHKGSKIKMIISEQGNLSIAPEFVAEDKKLETVIPFDRCYQGRFFRAYFFGNEKITFLFKSLPSENERKKFYLFLKKFMNVQIIDDTSTRMVIKCFRIDDLTIEECLKRMYFLSLTLFDELMEDKDQTKIQETRETMVRFYYMLIMQIRRYLAEGKFIEGNQISLLRAMDYRMVAEKIHRLGELLEKMDRTVNPKELEKVKEMYSKTFNYYLNGEFEKAAPFLFELNEEEKRLEKSLLKPVLRYSKEICRLTR